jgi:glucose/mannose-6-phosphate isomerase
MSLDETSSAHEIDRSDMLSMMERTSARLVPPADAMTTCPGRLGEADNVVLAGVGGSGIIGDILLDCLREDADIPVVVSRGLRVPRFVGKRTLFIAISYSGETAETLGQVEQGSRKGAKIVVVTSGGRLLSKAKSKDMRYLRVSSDIPPRLALPELLASAVFAVGLAELLGDTTQLLSQAAKSVGDVIEEIKLSVPSQRNQAKQMAYSLVDKLPLLLGNEAYESALRRFKNDLNENSKVPAEYYTLPEAYHNDIEGLSELRRLTSPQPIMLRIRNEVDSENRTREQLVRLLKKLDFPPILDLEGKGKEKLSQLLTATTFASYVSVYLAILRRVDPAELRSIPEFRAVAQRK